MTKLKRGDAEGGKSDIAAATRLMPNIAEEQARYGVQ